MKQTLMHSTAVAAVVAALLVPAQSPAQEKTLEKGVEKALKAVFEKPFATSGITEIGGRVSFSSLTPVAFGQSLNSITVLSIGPEIGYFVADGFEIGFSPGVTLLPGVTSLSSSGTDNATVVQLFVYPAYYIHSDESSVNPFLQVPVGYTSASQGSAKGSGLSWGVKGGIKAVATGHFLLSVYVEYMALNFSTENSTQHSGLNVFSFGVAVGGFL